MSEVLRREWLLLIRSGCEAVVETRDVLPRQEVRRGSYVGAYESDELSQPRLWYLALGF